MPIYTVKSWYKKGWKEKVWVPKTWSGLTSFYGYNVWTDGDDLYYSTSGNNYVLNKATSAWSTKTWTGLTSVVGSRVWVYSSSVYCTPGTNYTYTLNKGTSTWSESYYSDVKVDNVYVPVSAKPQYSNGQNYGWYFDPNNRGWRSGGATNFYPSYCWNDGEYDYYSYGT